MVCYGVCARARMALDGASSVCRGGVPACAALPLSRTVWAPAAVCLKGYLSLSSACARAWLVTASSLRPLDRVVVPTWGPNTDSHASTARAGRFGAIYSQGGEERREEPGQSESFPTRRTSSEKTIALLRLLSVQEADQTAWTGTPLFADVPRANSPASWPGATRQFATANCCWCWCWCCRCRRRLLAPHLPSLAACSSAPSLSRSLLHTGTQLETVQGQPVPLYKLK